MTSRLRIGFAIAGLAAAVASVALDDHRLAWLAIALLAISLGLRLLTRKGTNRRGGTDSPV